MDAAQFFKAGSMKRGMGRIEDSLDRVQTMTGLKHVAVSGAKSVHGSLCKESWKSDRTFRVISFQDTKCCLAYIYEGKFLTVGDCVLAGKQGWPMGSHVGVWNSGGSPGRFAHNFR